MDRRRKRQSEVNSSYTDDVKRDFKKVKTAKKKSNDSAKKQEDENNLSVNASQLMDDSGSKRKASRSQSKRYASVKNEPKIKREKVARKKLKVEGTDSEQSSHNSTDSGVLLEPALVLAKCEPHVLSPAKKAIQTSTPILDSSGIGEEASSSESEWEEVEDNKEQSLDDYKPEIPKEGVEITIDCPELNIRKRKKKQFDWNNYIRLYINRERKEAQLNIQKCHLLCLIAHGFYVNRILNSSFLKAVALSLIENDLLAMTGGRKIDKIDSDGIERILKWFCSSFELEVERDSFINISQNLVKYFENHKALNSSEYNLMFIIIARVLGFKTRFCISLYPLTHKATNLIKATNGKRNEKKVSVEKIELKNENGDEPSKEVKNAGEGPSKIKPNNKKPEKKEKAKTCIKRTPTSKLKKERTARTQRSATKSYKISSDESDDDLRDEDFNVDCCEDDDFVKPKVYRHSLKTPNKNSNRKVLSSDSEPSSPENHNFNSCEIICWAEIFSKPDKKWISVECVNKLVNKPYEIERIAPKPVTYILAYDNNDYVKDVTRRYCNEYMTSTIKLRADPDWWEETLAPFLPPNSKLDKDEEKDLDSMLINKPLPTTVAGFKNHPLYVLKRHLLKFEALYPPDAAPVGFIRGEPVYARDNVAQLHSRETWLKEARVVRIGEEPYKIVKARPKWDKIAGVLRTDLPLEIFGFWQTEPYEPPIAVDGKVPRNEYGNVELFKPCMLPRGTVHLQIPGVNRIARKLGIDCSAAVVGFDGHKGSVHPVFDGFIVCEEYKDTILLAWEEEQENARKREAEKREKRIYGNWKKLIRGLLIREKIKLKYDVK